ncbi:hypothetical protein, conserved [Leishmania donovani]|uniref:Uncharacterized protein n=2 Tax=Leishmania donovani TaxID=5661 RepID=E9BQ19_LEIDO|nr:hypothetical protein, conserved [Leishmania donovani]AYU82064.1 hypothetical protein LdCL_330015100 [Leishmania donovani]CBZ37231.1 hypothetical protein, conserved [Leishmania donovani]
MVRRLAIPLPPFFFFPFTMLPFARVMRKAASATPPLPPPPPRVLVLTMIPNGGALSPALRMLGYHPYTFEDSVRKGRLLTHPQEWMAVMRGEKKFDFEVLKAPQHTASTEAVPSSSGDPCASRTPECATASTAPSASPRAPLFFDSLVGPPATVAFESILKECPRSTRVILVEEPDKLAWEKDMEQWLQPLVRECKKSAMWWNASKLHMMLLDMVDLRRALISPSNQRGGRARPLPSSFAAMTAQNVPISKQHSTLRLSGALDLFEQHVKEVVPRDRLLVYRVRDGWQPLCDFLQVPVPMAPATVGGAPPEPVAFPPNSTGSDILLFVHQGFKKSTAVVWLLFLVVVALALLLLSSFTEEYTQFYRDYRDYVHRDLEPYMDAEKVREGDESALTIRQALVMAKKSSKRFGEEYEREGGAMGSMSGLMERIVGSK